MRKLEKQRLLICYTDVQLWGPEEATSLLDLRQ